MSNFIKDAAAYLDYTVDTTKWLSPGDTISAYTWTLPSALSSGPQTQSGNLLTIWLRGGVDNTNYTLILDFTATPSGRQDRRLVPIQIMSRYAIAAP